MRFYYIILILSVSFRITAQVPDWQWAKSASGTVSETGMAVVKDEKGNTYITGQYGSSLISFGSFTLYNIGIIGTTDIFIVKYDSAGNVTWAKTFGGFGNEAGNDIAVDHEGNIYITGYFKSFNLLFGTYALVNTGGEDVFVAKFASNGSVKWAVNGGGAGWDRGNGISVDGEKNIYVTGYFNSTTIYFDTVQTANSSNYFYDIFLLKLDSFGLPLWVRKGNGTAFKNDKAFSVHCIPGGKTCITGYFESVTFTLDTFILENKGLSDVFIAWYDSAGNCLDAKSCSGDSLDWGISVASDHAGNTIVAGIFNSSYLKIDSDSIAETGFKDIFMVKYTNDGTLEWVKTSGGNHIDEVKGIAVDSGGNIYMTGFYYSPDIIFGSNVLVNKGGADIFITKYDSTGNVLWAKSFGEENNDKANDISVSSVAKIGICGGFTSPEFYMDAVQINNSGQEDVFTAELTSAGVSRWAKSAKGNAGNDGGISVAADPWGNVIVAGFFLSPVLTFNDVVLMNKGSSDIFLVKYDSSGNILWSRKAGGKYADEIKRMEVDGQGNIYMTGYFESDTLFFDTLNITSTDTGYSDIFIAKYDGNGNIKWAKKAGGTSMDIANGMDVSVSGNIYITGTFWSNSIAFDTCTISRVGTGDDAFIAKYDSAGTAHWAVRLGGDSYDEGFGIAADGNDNVIVTGYFTSAFISTGSDSLFNSGMKDAFIIKYSSTGTSLWSLAIGDVDDDEGKALATDKDGNIFLAGIYKSPFLTIGPSTLFLDNKNDIFLAKLDSSGTFIWARSINGSDEEYSTDLAVNDSGAVFISGYFMGPQLKLGSSYIMNTAASTYDFFIAKYDSSGDVVWIKSAGGTLNEMCTGIAASDNGNVFATGYFRSSTLPFGNTTLYATGNYDFFIAKLGYQIIGIYENDFIDGIMVSVYPNPSTMYTTISYKLSNRSEVKLDIFNATGKKVESAIRSEIQNAGSYQYLYAPPVSQIYFIRLQVTPAEDIEGMSVFTKKLIHLR